MIKKLLIILGIVSVVYSQSGLDILTIPTDAKDASMGINLNPTVKPLRMLTNPEKNITFSVWNWVADIQGAYMGIELENTHVSLQAVNSGELEYRDETPSEDPLSTFEYNLFMLGGSHVLQWDELFVGFGAELIHERTLNASSTGLSVNLAGAYELNDQLMLSGGLRHLGLSTKLDTVSTTVPAEAWLGVDASFGKLTALVEANTGSSPLGAGISYSLADGFDLMSGLQIEPADPSMKIYPSAGFTATWTTFTLGYSIYQMNHKVGPRHFLSLYWNY